jgi:hypothetical protein
MSGREDRDGNLTGAALVPFFIYGSYSHLSSEMVGVAVSFIFHPLVTYEYLKF